METTLSPAVIEEARRRQRRRRWLMAAIAFAAVVLGVSLALAGRQGGSRGSRASSVGSAGSRAAVASGTTQKAPQLSPRQAINATTVIKTVGGHETIGLGFENVSDTPATLLISLKEHLPLTRGEVVLNAPGEKFRNGTVTDPLPANRFKPFLDLELVLPTGSAGNVEVDLLRDFGAQGTPYTEIYSLGFGL
jgi:hypothetical protein